MAANCASHAIGVNGKFERKRATGIADLPGALPVADVPYDVDHAEVAAVYLERLKGLRATDLTDGAFWRDSWAMTGTQRTFHGGSSVAKAWNDTSNRYQPVDFALVPNSSRVLRHGPQTSWVDARFTFRTTGAQLTLSCSGFISLVPVSGVGWKIWMIRTILEQFEGVQSVDMFQLDIKAIDMTNRVEGSSRPNAFDCIVVGGGQAGLSTAGRLKALGISYVVLDKHPKVGDSWNTRYDAVKLHTAREYAHLPFERLFGTNYPEFLTKNHLAKGYQEWVKKYGIAVWCSTELLTSSWNEESRTWTCRLRRDGAEQVVIASHLVFAIGAGSDKPLTPQYPNRECFQGSIIHSSVYKNASEWNGKAGVVIGSANTAHDVAEDMLECGLSSVTMVQRGRTWVLPVENYMKVTIPVYNDKIPTEMSDRMQFSSPTVVSRQIAMIYLHRMAREQMDRFEALERVGFKVEPFGDIASILNERQGGHYMDVGASAKISDGQIKVKSDATPVHYTTTGLAFSDGTELKADVIVFSTGFVRDLRQLVGSIVGHEIEDQLEEYWGLDEEGELRGAFKDSGHPAIWYMGGALGHARYFSRFVALQIKAKLLGTPLPVYLDTPSV